MSKHPQVILYSTTQHTWEVWQTSRPIAHGSLEACLAHYPDAIPPDERQHALAASDTERTP